MSAISRRSIRIGVVVVLFCDSLGGSGCGGKIREVAADNDVSTGGMDGSAAPGTEGAGSSSSSSGGAGRDSASGDGDDASGCSAASCSGCCDLNNMCQVSENGTCGAGGSQCWDCTIINAICIGGSCETTDTSSSSSTGSSSSSGTGSGSGSRDGSCDPN